MKHDVRTSAALTLALLAGAGWRPVRRPASEFTQARARGPAPVANSSVGQDAAIRQLWSAYLASKRGKYGLNAGTPSPLWLASEQARWPMYDLAGFYLPDDALPRVLSVRPTTGRAANEYEIITRFTQPPSGRPGSVPAVVLTMTVYATMDSGRWVLANALPRKTASWQRETVGQITYFIEPGLTFNRTRAQRAVAFVDSLSAAFALPRLGPLDYYVTSSVDAALGIVGVQTPERYGPNGGFSKPVNRQVFSGIPALGENYRHELAHLVLRPLHEGTSITILGSEGMATWLGGTEGSDFRGAVRRLSEYLTTHPEVDLDSIMDSRSLPQWVRYSGGAVLCAMLADAGGAPALREFLRAGPGSAELRTSLMRLLKRPWQRVVAEWRQAAARIGST